MKMWFNIILVMLTFCVSAQNLNGSRWLLVSIDDLSSGISKDIQASTKVTLHFECDTIYSGRFCNSFCGTIRFNSNNTLKMIKPVTTRMTCMGLDKYEKEMLAIFSSTTKYRVEENNLYLFASTNKRLTYRLDK